MNEQTEQPAILTPKDPCQLTEWPMDDDARLATLSHFGAPYCEGDTPLFI
jgi:hypothetical protein